VSVAVDAPNMGRIGALLAPCCKHHLFLADDVASSNLHHRCSREGESEVYAILYKS